MIFRMECATNIFFLLIEDPIRWPHTWGVGYKSREGHVMDTHFQTVSIVKSHTYVIRSNRVYILASHLGSTTYVHIYCRCKPCMPADLVLSSVVTSLWYGGRCRSAPFVLLNCGWNWLKTLFWLNSCERKTLFRLKKQAEQAESGVSRTGTTNPCECSCWNYVLCVQF